MTPDRMRKRVEALRQRAIEHQVNPPATDFYGKSPGLEAIRNLTYFLWARREREVRKLLEQWVSELEPCLIFRNGLGHDEMIGIGVKDDPTGTVVLKAWL